MSAWIDCAERLPESAERDYQVVTVAKKKYSDDSNYPGQGIKAVNQDWVVRRWPQNFTHWCHLPSGDL